MSEAENLGPLAWICWCGRNATKNSHALRDPPDERGKGSGRQQVDRAPDADELRRVDEEGGDAQTKPHQADPDLRPPIR